MFNSKKGLLTTLLVLMMVIMLPSVVFAGTQDFTLINNSGYSITGFWVAPSDGDSWEDDLIEEPLRNGESLDITFDKANKTKYWNFSIKDGNGKTWNWEKKDYVLDNISEVIYTYKNGRGWIDFK